MKKGGAIALTLLVLTMSVSVLVFSTLALFTDTAETNNRIEAGTLEIGLYETALDGNRLNEEGRFESLPALTEAVDLETYDGKLIEMESACPGMWREATLELRNAGSTTAFHYSVTICGVEAEGESSLALYEQINVTVTDKSGQTTEFKLSEAASADGKTVELGTMLANETAHTFKVKAEFEDSENNNLAKLGSVSFDIRVTATQVVPEESA